MRRIKKGLILLVTATIVATNPIKTNASELYYEYCVEIRNQYGIAPELLQAIVWTESRGDSSAKNGNATGLCQIIPSWHYDRMARLGVTDLSDPYQNILVCADFVAELRDTYGDDLYVILNYYNTGNIIYDATTYSTTVTEKAFELEQINGKHNY